MLNYGLLMFYLIMDSRFLRRYLVSGVESETYFTYGFISKNFAPIRWCTTHGIGIRLVFTH